MNSLVRDVRYTVRQSRRSPGFAVVAILTLGLGIGANAVVFSGISSLLLHGLPVASPDRISFLEKPGGHGGANNSYPVSTRVNVNSSAPRGEGGSDDRIALRVEQRADTPLPNVWLQQLQKC